jgi:hypothetical protein
MNCFKSVSFLAPLASYLVVIFRISNWAKLGGFSGWSLMTFCKIIYKKLTLICKFFSFLHITARIDEIAVRVATGTSK